MTKLLKMDRPVLAAMVGGAIIQYGTPSRLRAARSSVEPCPRCTGVGDGPAPAHEPCTRRRCDGGPGGEERGTKVYWRQIERLVNAGWIFATRKPDGGYTSRFIITNIGRQALALTEEL